jgi:glyoxylase-like metal-dependent hydrolase (beta-lactamase superfamily II)
MAEKYIEWIGTGSGLNPVLGNTSFMVRGTDRTLLVDCGSTVPLELMKSGQIGDVTDILITHAHADHIGGLEGLGFMNYFALRRRGDDRPNLYVASDDFAHKLWYNSLLGGMQKIQEDDGTPVDATLETYFKIHTGRNVRVGDLPEATMFETPHVQDFENYGVRFANGVFYSGDTLNLPPSDPRLIFQDCQFFVGPNDGAGDVHISYDKLKKELSPEVRAKTYLVHLGGGWDKKDPTEDGFAGFVKPKDRFDM